MPSFTLYRFFDAEDALLYVGLTINPGKRFEKHRATKPWWEDVARIVMERHADIAALRAAERVAIKTEKPRHNIRMNGSAPAPLKIAAGQQHEIDGLVGRHFHTWRERREGDSRERCTIRDGRVLEYQGRVTEQLDDMNYLIQLYSFWDGFPSDGEKLASLDEMRSWTFYDSALEMQIAYGCTEFDSHRCGGEVTHYFDNRVYGLGLQLLCYGCVKRYPGFKNAKALKWVDGKPSL
jgi:GIY-YIG catalytic domain